MAGTFHGAGKRARMLPGALFALGLAALIVLGVVGSAGAVTASSPGKTYVNHRAGSIVAIPDSIPHQAGARIDRRLIPNLRYISRRFKIYITEGYAGPLPGGKTVGCPECHTRGSDHFTGLAVDIAARSYSGTCDASWRTITALAKWAEPRQNVVLAPFRWVGYNGDSGHGCGHHLHLSWNAAPTPSFEIADSVELFRVRRTAAQPPQVFPTPEPSGGTTSRAVGDGDGSAESGGVSVPNDR